MRKFYEGLIATGNGFQHVLLLAIRLYWGLSFLFAGWGKFHNIESVSNYFSSLNIPLPYLSAYLAASAEFLGGFLLVIGLASRLATIPLISTMVVAFATAHRQSLMNIFEKPEDLISEKAFTFLLAVLIIFAFGPGMFSIDAILKRFVFKTK